jgi:hypothetical protein
MDKLKNKGEKTNMKFRNLVVAVILSICGLSISIVLILAVCLIKFSSATHVILLPLLAISGVSTLLTIITIVAVAFSALNLHDPNQALGLPRGSVRALIALSLIILFAIMAIFLFDAITYPHYRYNVTLVNGSPEYYTTLVEPSIEGVRIAQQILTTVSTLVVAVAGFYFGTRSAEAARRTSETPSLSVLNPSSPVKLDMTKGSKLDTPIEIETSPKGEVINWEVEGDDPESLVQVKPNEFMYTRGSSPKDIVTLTFSLVSHPNIKEEFVIESASKKEKTNQ